MTKNMVTLHTYGGFTPRLSKVSSVKKDTTSDDNFRDTFQIQVASWVLEAGGTMTKNLVMAKMVSHFSLDSASKLAAMKLLAKPAEFVVGSLLSFSGDTYSA